MSSLALAQFMRVRDKACNKRYLHHRFQRATCTTLQYTTRISLGKRIKDERAKNYISQELDPLFRNHNAIGIVTEVDLRLRNTRMTACVE